MEKKKRVKFICEKCGRKCDYYYWSKTKEKWECENCSNYLKATNLDMPLNRPK
jgi:ribosomal protein L37AE/L43A